MTRDEILSLAREVWDKPTWSEPQTERLERFAALVTAAQKDALLEALKNIEKSTHDAMTAALARVAIAKAEEST